MQTKNQIPVDQNVFIYIYTHAFIYSFIYAQVILEPPYSSLTEKKNDSREK